MSSIKLKGSTSGEITISAPAVAGTNTLTLPASTGEITVGGNNTPLVMAKLSADQSGISDVTTTKIAFDTSVYEVGATFDTSNNRFTVPSDKGGYYKVDLHCTLRSSTAASLIQAIIYLYKNGSQFEGRKQINTNTNFLKTLGLGLTTIMNLSAGDYVEGYARFDTNGTVTRDLVSAETYINIHKLIT